MHDWNYGFVIDGFPRNARQAEFFLESYDIDGVINLELPDAEVDAAGARPPAVLGLRARLQPDRPPPEGRRTCATCAAASSSSREDDNPEALAVRLRDYHEKTKPIIELFQRKEFVARIDATRSVAEIQAEIRARLRPPAAEPDVDVTPLVHDGGMTTDDHRSRPRTADPAAHAGDVPMQFRLDVATRQRGLRHIAEIRARLDRARSATRAPAPPGGRPARAA